MTFTVLVYQNGSHILEFPLCKYDTNIDNLTDNNRIEVVSSTSVNNDLQSTYFDKLKADYLYAGIINSTQYVEMKMVTNLE